MSHISIFEQLVVLDYRVSALRNRQPKIAALDLDDTLLIGDIGEAVFCELVASGALPARVWDEYRDVLRNDRPTAYRAATEILRGFSVDRIGDATRAALFHPNAASPVPRPRPHSVMRSVVNLLRQRDYDVCVISASNAVSVRIASATLFGIPPHRAFGVESALNGVTLTGIIHTPTPIHEGKAAVYRRHFGDVAPLITAGDSMMDFPLLQLTDPLGISLWVGNDRAAFRLLRHSIPFPQIFCYVPRQAVSQLAEQHADIR